MVEVAESADGGAEGSAGLADDAVMVGDGAVGVARGADNRREDGLESRTARLVARARR